MDNATTWCAAITVATAIFAAGLGVGKFVGVSQTTHIIHTEAVKAGYGRWLVDYQGNTTFIWISPTQGETSH